MSVTEEIKPVEVRVSGLEISKFFSEDLIELVNQGLEGFQFQHFCMYLTKKNEDGEVKTVDRITISHDTPKDAREKIVNISTETPETLEKVLKVTRQLIG